MEEAKGAAKEAAEEATQNAIESKMTEVTKHISESSVTILGIFSGIVLTVVAGLFYSSSVLESVKEADFFRLMFISALIGLVCFGLIVVMFRFIEKISGKCEGTFLSDGVVKLITIILCIVMCVGFALQFDSTNDKNNKTDVISTDVYSEKETTLKELITEQSSTQNHVVKETTTK